MTVGTAEGATMRLTDPTVSRFQLELEAVAEGIAIRDLGSRNGTTISGMRIREVIVEGAVQIDVGQTRLAVELAEESASVELSDSKSFGALLGSSAAMREVYTALERAAPTNAPVLITGESGTGKELAARAIHEASPRREQPYEVVDCGGLPPTLIESELFGHERGAFTGAGVDRQGAFERAQNGTLFLDELGELPLALQPKLLRALGEREIRRIGGQQAMPIDVRIIAATNRDLRAEVNAGRFRADLFYRLAVIQIRMPALRDRLSDLSILARSILDAISRDRQIDTTAVALDAELWNHRWPGNVRELRNYLEQLVILKVPPPLAGPEPSPDPDALTSGLDSLPLPMARSELLARFERRYVTKLLERTNGNVAEAARVSGVNRTTVFRMIRRYGVRDLDSRDE
jgi:DNA-binding NtrC family response regulator